jgi:hypothetical protein
MASRVSSGWVRALPLLLVAVVSACASETASPSAARSDAPTQRPSSLTTAAGATSAATPAATAAPTAPPAQASAAPPTTQRSPVPTTPAPPPTAVSLCGAPSNPWGYNFCGRGTTISSPPANFCNYFNCIASFWNGHGYVTECRDATFSKSGGISGSCSGHGGNGRTLYG